MVKVLFIGDVFSEFEILMKRVTTLNTSASGPFDLVLSTGQFFKDSDGDYGSLCMPIPTYILPHSCLANILPGNVFVMKECGLQSIHGLTIATNTKDSLFPSEDLQSTKESHFRGCDIFISSDWPREFYHFLDEEDLTNLKANIGLSIGCSIVADIAAAIKPRYHFSSKYDFFYQRCSFHLYL